MATDPKNTKRRAGVLFEIEETPASKRAARATELPPEREPGPGPFDPASAPPVPDDEVAPSPSGRAMQTVALLAARKERSLAKWVWSTLGAVLTFVLSIAAWEFVTGLLASNPILGWIATLLFAAFLVACGAVILRELSALSRLDRIDGIRREAAAVTDLTSARKLSDRLVSFYAGRPDTRWGREALEGRRDEIRDAPALIAEIERDLLAPLDAAAAKEVEAAARQVALVTAVVPLAMADVVAALTSNLRMIRRIALIYGGRGGTLGSWRLARTVLTHLAATGAVAVGDDLIHSVAGGGVLARVSRRFGEGLVNGALTARVGLAAMEVCRPLPFTHAHPPRITELIRRSLTGLFDRKDT
ncbi:YcjF family protein [Jannaschia seohaensis]|uniref:Putative membrane protein n=1 Tax=Jannaschia seohaensis TaxID=475081 RepID=A0A2Y9A487_9RHOB|nr:TIGR01620 family protein [Jannaschia seohaensis]PWJ22418.1 putative membrane protein [Jannaschia seohaensis]SSA38696.1 putative membrane protein [Jannaschia seohaensis]